MWEDKWLANRVNKGLEQHSSKPKNSSQIGSKLESKGKGNPQGSNEEHKQNRNWVACQEQHKEKGRQEGYSRVITCFKCHKEGQYKREF